MRHPARPPYAHTMVSAPRTRCPRLRPRPHRDAPAKVSRSAAQRRTLRKTTSNYAFLEHRLLSLAPFRPWTVLTEQPQSLRPSVPLRLPSTRVPRPYSVSVRPATRTKPISVLPTRHLPLKTSSPKTPSPTPRTAPLRHSDSVFARMGRVRERERISSAPFSFPLTRTRRSYETTCARCCPAPAHEDEYRLLVAVLRVFVY